MVNTRSKKHFATDTENKTIIKATAFWSILGVRRILYLKLEEWEVSLLTY